MTARVSMLLKSRASPDILPFSLCNKKKLAIWHMNRPLVPTTLSIPSYDIGQHPLVCSSITLNLRRGTLIEALRYKPEGRSFDSRWCIGIFHRHNPSGRTMALGLTQLLTEMSTRNISWGVKVPVRRDDNLITSMCRRF